MQRAICMSSAVVYGMGNQAYRDSEGLAHSDSRRLRKSPFHYQQLRQPRDPELVKKPTAAMELGTMVHCAVLEPAEFSNRYVIGPDINHNTTVWKTFAAACVEQGLQPITQQQFDQVHGMAASVRKLPDFAALLDGCSTEVSLWWDCEQTGVLCKARPDLVKHFPGGSVILGDLKTTEDAGAEAFARSVADYSYHTQAHWYSEGATATLGTVVSFLFAVVESSFPYAACSYTLDDAAMKIAADINLAVRERFKQCDQLQQWPGYPSETRDLALPSWYMARYLAGQIT